jgi:integrase/recombinase XerD
MKTRTTTNDYPGSFDAAMRRLLGDKNIHPDTRDDILRFQKQIAVEGLSLGRQMKYLTELRRLFSGSAKPVKEWTRDDVNDLVSRIDSAGYTFWTRYTYRVTLKRLFKWLRKTDSYPPEVKDIRMNNKMVQTSKLPTDILSEEEVGRMIANCEHTRDAAFISCLYETGCRPDELGSLRLNHVIPDTHGFVLTVTGKTGMRRVRVCLFARILASWIDRHPQRDDVNAPLWPSYQYPQCQSPICSQTINKMVKQAAKRAGMRKRIYPYLFRHSRATYLATRLTEAQMNMVFGWKQGSDMPRTYVHLSGRDIDEALLQIAGVAKADARPKESILKPKPCARCSLENPGTSRFCMRCAAPLDHTAVFEAEDEAAATGRLMTTLIKDDPDIQAMLKEKIKKMLTQKPASGVLAA